MQQGRLSVGLVLLGVVVVLTTVVDAGRYRWFFTGFAVGVAVSGSWSRCKAFECVGYSERVGSTDFLEKSALMSCVQIRDLSNSWRFGAQILGVWKCCRPRRHNLFSLTSFNSQE